MSQIQPAVAMESAVGGGCLCITWVDAGTCHGAMEIQLTSRTAHGGPEREGFTKRGVLGREQVFP